MLADQGWEPFFEPFGSKAEVLAYRHPGARVIIRDAHNGNFIFTTNGKLVPTNVSVEYF